MKWGTYSNGDSFLACDVVRAGDDCIHFEEHVLAEVSYREGIYYIEYLDDLSGFETEVFTGAGITKKKVMEIAEKRVRDTLARIADLWKRAVIFAEVGE